MRCLLWLRNWYNGQELSSNTYRPQFIQQTAMTNSIKCSWEVQLKKSSFHASVQSNLQTARQSNQRITCSQCLRYKNWEGRSTQFLSKNDNFPATIFSNTFDGTGVIEIVLYSSTSEGVDPFVTGKIMANLLHAGRKTTSSIQVLKNDSQLRCQLPSYLLIK